MNRCIVVTMVFVLAGCSATPEKLEAIDSANTEREVLATAQEQKAAIDEEVLYLLMAAELAGQRNQYDLALDAYLQAAKRVDDPRIAERAVKIGLFLKDEKRTQEALAIWLDKDGKNLSARKFALLIAIKNANQEVAVDPAGFEAGLLELVKLFEKEGRVKFTLDALNQVASQNAEQPNLLFVQAVLASMLPDLALAQEKITRVLELQPDWNRAIIFQAQLAGRLGEMSQAKRYLEKAIKLAPEDIVLKRMLVEVLVNSDALDDAVRLSQTILEQKPDDPETLMSLALIHLQQNQLDRGEVYLEKLVLNPDWDDQAVFYLGKLQQQRKQYDKALAWFDRVIEGRFAFEANMSAVAILLNSNRVDEAQQRLLKMEERFPEQHLRILMLKAEILNQQGNHQAAFNELTVALKEMPDNPDILYTRALIAEKLNKLDVLEADLIKVLEKNPEDVRALNALGYTLADRTNRYEDADHYLQRALQLQPDEPVVIDSFGWLLYKKGMADRALPYLKRAYEKQPETEIAAHVIEVLLHLGEKKQARELFEAINKKTPQDEFINKIRSLFQGGL
ncbi:MAG: hypothetical protein EBR59_03130 [Methylococcaceae bacterium]|nr:hypothetical protein [Methylococcaceae bacterium]